MKRNKKIGWISFFLCASLLGAPYTDNGNGTVTDSVTNLLWQKCSAGQGTTLGNCSTGNVSSYTWPNAITYCEGLTLGGRSDWRLPNINELRSIVDYGKSTNYSTSFPNTQSNDYWSSSTYTRSTSNAWGVSFSFRSVNFGSKTNGYYVRCVTGP